MEAYMRKIDKNQKEHLPLYGVGPIIVIPQILVTVAAILLSKAGILYSLRIGAAEIPFVIMGALLILFGVWLWYSAAFRTKIDTYIEENHLATTGVYSIVRNPLYSGYFLLCIGLVLIEGNVILLILPLLNYLYMTLMLIHTEEKWLRKLYGQEYEDYCQKVNRCIPWFPRRL